MTNFCHFENHQLIYFSVLMQKKTYISIASIIISILLLIYAIDMCYTLDYFYDFTGKGLGEKGNLWFRKDIAFLLQKKEKIHDIIWMTALYIHIIGSLSAILIGPFQFISYFREKFKKIHRFLGKIYIECFKRVAKCIRRYTMYT